MMLQCAMRLVETQKRGLLTVRRILALKKILARHREALLRSFLRWRYHTAAADCWVMVEAGVNVEESDGRAAGLEILHSK